MGGMMAPKQFTPPGALGSVPADVMNPSTRFAGSQAQGFNPATLAPTTAPTAPVQAPTPSTPSDGLLGYQRRPTGMGQYNRGNRLQMSVE
jgi:hypothetical protein